MTDNLIIFKRSFTLLSILVKDIFDKFTNSSQKSIRRRLIRIDHLELLLSLIAVVLVIALIPFYFDKQTITDDPTNQNMKISHMELTIDPTLAESFDDLVGGEFDLAGRELTRQYLLENFDSSKFVDFIVTRVTIDKSEIRKKRSLLSKRIRRKDLALILIVEFFHQCQITTISSVVQTLVEAAGRFNFENVSILIDRIEIATISFQTVGVNNVRTSREENR